MKILKYGEGYEPKVITCENCKSEIEYLDIETKQISHSYQDLDGNVWASLPQQDCVCTYKMGIKCPICHYYTTTSEKHYEIGRFTLEPKPKKRWWKR